jgi:hypothetical protein
MVLRNTRDVRRGVGAWLVFAQRLLRDGCRLCVLAAVMLTGPAGSPGAARTGLGWWPAWSAVAWPISRCRPARDLPAHTAAAARSSPPRRSRALRPFVRYAMLAATGWMLVTTARVALHWGESA